MGTPPSKAQKQLTDIVTDNVIETCIDNHVTETVIDNVTETCKDNVTETCKDKYVSETVKDSIIDKVRQNESEKIGVDDMAESHCKKLSGESSKKFLIKTVNSETNLDKYCAVTHYPFNASFLKFGSFDQFDLRFQDESRGNQCTCNA